MDIYSKLSPIEKDKNILKWNEEKLIKNYFKILILLKP